MSKAKIRIIAAFLAKNRRQCNPDRAVVKSTPHASLSFFSLRRRRATLAVLATDCECGAVEKA
jgi:hypothetical protein